MEKYIDKLYDHYNKEKAAVGRARKRTARVGDKDSEGGGLDEADEELSDAEDEKVKPEENPLLVDVEHKQKVGGGVYVLNICTIY
jgi:hypothetical protein